MARCLVTWLGLLVLLMVLREIAANMAAMCGWTAAQDGRVMIVTTRDTFTSLGMTATRVTTVACDSGLMPSKGPLGSPANLQF